MTFYETILRGTQKTLFIQGEEGSDVSQMYKQGNKKNNLNGHSFLLKGKIDGGAERDRTADLLNAIQALSQLSYSPTTN